MLRARGSPVEVWALFTVTISNECVSKYNLKRQQDTSERIRRDTEGFENENHDVEDENFIICDCK